MPGKSLIYRNLYFYRATLNLLYTGSYRKRFRYVTALIQKFAPQNITELCFGDTILAQYCREHNIHWTGIDINAGFVKSASARGFRAFEQDLLSTDVLPAADICIMMGSFYHFHATAHEVLKKMLASAPVLVISEPVKNLSDHKGVIGWMAHKLSDAGKGSETFRFNERSLLELLESLSDTLDFSYHVEAYFKKDIIIVLQKK